MLGEADGEAAVAPEVVGVALADVVADVLDEVVADVVVDVAVDLVVLEVAGDCGLWKSVQPSVRTVPPSMLTLSDVVVIV